MIGSFKQELRRAVYLVIIVALVAIVANWIRTPVVNALAENGSMSGATAFNLGGVRLVDNWSHEGWPMVAKNEPVDDQTDDDGGNEPDPSDDTQNTKIPQVVPIDLFAAEALFEEGECIFIDARHPEYYEEGHIPGAYNWPVDEFDEYYDQFMDLLDPDDCVVVYCSGGACDESNALGQDLIIEGFTDVKLFTGGIEEWELILEIASGPDPGEKPEPESDTETQ